tara:strand:+ start:7061 stop:7726 length:666 start_codon:yes stop_codon:yes gene_type:complete
VTKPSNEIKRILIIDDDILSAKITLKKLEKKGFEVEARSSAIEFLNELKPASKINFDMILLDVMMPDISGLEVLEKIRAIKNNIELPVIMVTSKDETEDIVKALRLGANDYVTKPMNLEVVMARMKTQFVIQELIGLSLQAEQANTINSMVTTLNHEINNPLAIAIGNLTICQEKPDNVRIDKALKALDRITQIVKKIEKITEGEIEEVEYSPSSNMYKIE